MVRNFRALQEFLEYRYPELRGRVHGSNYPPPQFGAWVMRKHPPPEETWSAPFQESGEVGAH